MTAQMEWILPSEAPQEKIQNMSSSARLSFKNQNARKKEHRSNLLLGPPVERLEQGYSFFSSLFSRGTLPTKKGVRKGTFLGDLANFIGFTTNMVTLPQKWLTTNMLGLPLKLNRNPKKG